MDDVDFARVEQLVQAAELQARATTGACPVCRRSFTLTKDGKVRHHGAKDGSWPPRNCDGWGKTPTEAA
jgi:hypothetical protein